MVAHAMMRGGQPPAPATASPPPGAAGVASATASPELRLDEPLGQEGWEKSMARQVLELSEKGAQRATLRLNPANLGALEVQVTTEEGEARIRFNSHHAVVREAVEAALPRLRDMFQGSGMDLVQVDVSRRDASAHQHSSGGGGGQERHEGASGAVAGFEETEIRASASPSPLSNRLIDYYA
jgi:flagellar hook-length control protein FliK